MASIYSIAKALGAEVVAENPLPARVRLALAAVQAVIDNEIEPSDAKELYEAYYQSKSKRDQEPTSHKVQVSKLRGILKLAKARPRQALPLLNRVVHLHGRFEGEIPPVQLYEGMVDTARAQLLQDERLTDDKLVELLTQKLSSDTVDGLKKKLAAARRRIATLEKQLGKPRK